MLNKWTYITVIVIIGTLFLGALLWTEYHAGGKGTELKYTKAAIKTEHKQRARDAKITRSVPMRGNAVDSFLLAHTR